MQEEEESLPEDLEVEGEDEGEAQRTPASRWPPSPYLRPCCVTLWANYGPTMRSWLIL